MRDCGNKLEYLQASIAFGLRSPDIAPGLAEYMHHIVKTQEPNTCRERGILARHDPI